ncbi:hypothetical protein [Flindersiella endophytica]
MRTNVVPSEPRYARGLAGRFRASCRLNGGRASLTTWRVTTEQREAANRIHDLYGGQRPGVCDEIGEGEWQVFTTADEIKIVVADSGCFRQETLDWGARSETVTTVRFQLADAPELGEFAFISGSPSLAGLAEEVVDEVAEIDGPAGLRLRLVLEYERENSEAEGTFTRPTLELIGPA